MIRRRSTIWISVAVAVSVVVSVSVSVSDVVGVGVSLSLSLSLSVATLRFARERGHSVRVRRPQSSGLPGGVGGLRVSLGDTMRCLLQACTSVDRLVDYLLDRTVEKLPAAASARFAEEWQDHRKHYSGWRLVWWALCVRATAMRTVAALGPARLPRDS